MAHELTAAQTRPSRADVVRYLLGAVLGIAILLLLFSRRGDLAAAARQLAHVQAGWVAVAVAAEALSIWFYAVLQHRALRLSGAVVAMPSLFLLSLANDAIVSTVPGGAAVTAAYRFRYYRRRGAATVSAGWTIFTVVIALAIGLSLLIMCGVVVALAASTGARAVGALVAGIVIAVAAGTILIRRDLVVRLASAVVRGAGRLTGYPRDRRRARIDTALTQMGEIPLGTWSTAQLVAIATAVWSADFLCLLCSFHAVHAPIPWDGVLLAYGAAQVVGTIPIIPGGIGIVEGSLAVILIAYGAGRVPALSTALTYRMVSFWLVIFAGWISVGVLEHQLRRRGTRGTHRADDAGHSSMPARLPD